MMSWLRDAVTASPQAFTEPGVKLWEQLLKGSARQVGPIWRQVTCLLCQLSDRWEINDKSNEIKRNQNYEVNAKS
jgi:hypothetical protein